MNKLTQSVLVLVVLCVAASLAVADLPANFSYGGRDYTSTAIVSLGYDYTWHGGSFSVQLESGALPGWLLHRTFCVESDIYFTPGDEYYATIDSFAARGSAGNPDTEVKLLTKEAAWIYQQYVSGGLNEYADHSDRAISEAIWFSMQQVGGVDNKISQDATKYATGIGNVRVMNLWTLDASYEGEDGHPVYTPTDVQSQLIMIPAPAGVLLGMIGLGMIGWLKRRFA